MVLKKISDLTSASAMTNTDLLEIAEADSGSASGYVSKKVTGQKLKEFASEDSVQWSDNNVIGTTNLIPFPYREKSTTKNGLDITVNSDYSISFGNNKPSGNTNFYLVNKTSIYNAGTYKLTGFADTNQGGDFCLRAVINQDMPNSEIYNDNGNGVEFTLAEGDKLSIYFHLSSNGLPSSSDLKHYPMLRLASDTETDYMPYTMTSRQVTLFKLDGANVATLENGDTTSKAYTIGDYMLWKGALHKVTANISSGGAITLNTNVVATTIGDELKLLFNS